jgi:hypothetical protein
VKCRSIKYYIMQLERKLDEVQQQASPRFNPSHA